MPLCPQLENPLKKSQLLPVDRDVLVQVSGQEAERTVIKVLGELGCRGDLDGGLHGLTELLVTNKDELVLSGKNGQNSRKNDQELEHFFEYKSNAFNWFSAQVLEFQQKWKRERGKTAARLIKPTNTKLRSWFYDQYFVYIVVKTNPSNMKRAG